MKRLKVYIKIFTQSLTKVTNFNPPGGGRPLLGKNTPVKISTGGFDSESSWEEKTSWPSEYDGWQGIPLESIFKKFKTEDEDRAISFMCLLADYVFTKAAPSSINTPSEE